jgi:hypothetical protein
MLPWVVNYRFHPRRTLPSLHSRNFSPFPVVDPHSIQQLTKCSSRNSFVLNSIHFDGGGTPLYEEIMNSNKSHSTSTIDIPAVISRHASPEARALREGRCQHLLPNGKRCKKFATASHFGLCRQHYDEVAAIGVSLQHEQSDFTDLSADLLPELSDFTAGADIRQFLARLLVLVTKGRISPRRASVLGYLSNLLLHSHRAINQETKLQLELDPPRIDWSDWPRPIQQREDPPADSTITRDVPNSNRGHEKKAS